MSETTSGKALVTGGAGFLGPHLIERLLQRGWFVLAIDNLSSGRLENLDRFAANPAFTFAQGDIVDGEFLSGTVCEFQPDTVFHLAAIHFIPYCIAHPAETLRVNVLGTQLLLDALTNIRARNFIQASTADVYVASETPHVEGDPLGTSNIYGMTKIFGEELLNLAKMRYPGVRFFSARFSNLFGPGETNPHVLPDIMAGMRCGSELRLGNLEPRRDYIYVGDAADALITMADYEGEDRTFNVSSGTGSSVLDLVETIERLTGRILRIKIDPAKIRRIERMSLVLNNSLIRRALNWMPLVTLEEGLRLTLAEEAGAAREEMSASRV